MSTMIDLKQIERRANYAAFQDGLMEIAMGLFQFFFGGGALPDLYLASSQRIDAGNRSLLVGTDLWPGARVRMGGPVRVRGDRDAGIWNRIRLSSSGIAVYRNGPVAPDNRSIHVCTLHPQIPSFKP